MKWKIIISKGDIVKEAEIEITSNAQAVGKIIQEHGWNVDYLAPISDMLDDEDTQIIEIGAKRHEDTLRS
jgi:hypothetical protein